MSIRIEVKKVDVQDVSGNAKRTGKPYAFKKQTAWAHLYDRKGTPDDYPTRIEVTLDDGQAPYPPGVYTLAPSSFYSGSFGALECSPRLTPIKS
jgi:hypothetical protein